eukprot:4523569-Karenia_brevis.AAC.1
MSGVPWQPNPKRKTNKIATHIKEEQEEEDEEDISREDEEKFDVQVDMEQDENQDVPEKPNLRQDAREIRGMPVRRDDIRKFGPTKGCPGCRAIIENWTYIHSHDARCRARISERLMEEVVGRARVERAEELQRQKQDSNPS